MQSLGFVSTEGAKVFLSRLPSHLFGVTAEPSDTSGQAPLRAAGALPPADLRLQGGLFQSLVSLTVGAERALSDCASRPVGFPGAPLLETMAGVATEDPACHLASWQAAEPRWKLNPIGMLQVLRAPGQGLKHRPGDNRATRSFSAGRGGPMGFLGVWGGGAGPPEERPREGGLQKPGPICESRAGRGHGQAREQPPPHPTPAPPGALH